MSSFARGDTRAVARPCRPRHKEQLRELCVDRGLSAAEIAAQVGGGTTRVTAALNRYGIPLRPARRRRVPTPDVDAATLTDVYVDRRLDDAEIGARYGVPAWRVKGPARRQLGAARRVVPPPHPGPPPAPPAEELRRLYLDEGLPRERIARHCRTAAPVVRRWLREARIPVRPRRAREHRRRLDLDTDRQLYQEQGGPRRRSPSAWARTPTRSCGRFTTPACLSASGAPGRAGDQPDRRSVASLYADPDIAAALREHDVSARDHPGSIADRFPTPSALPNRCCKRSIPTWACPPARSNCSLAKRSSGPRRPARLRHPRPSPRRPLTLAHPTGRVIK